MVTKAKPTNTPSAKMPTPAVSKPKPIVDRSANLGKFLHKPKKK